MKERLLGAVAALAIALGALAVPIGAAPVQAASTCTGWASTLRPPTTIRVYRVATRRTQVVSFRTYVEKVMAAEWGPTNPPAALRAGALTVKQYGWYYTMHWRGGRDAIGRCFDVVDSTRDQLYNPARTVPLVTKAAVAATWWTSLRKGDFLFMTGYRPGTGVCTAHLDGWHLFQRDASNCARRYGDSTETILRRFYSNLSYVTPGANDVSGDGKGDAILAITDPATGVLTTRTLTTDGAYATAAATSASTAIATLAPGVLIGQAAGDVTGDGRVDLVQLVHDGDAVELQVAIATRGGFAPAVTWWSSATDPGLTPSADLRLVVGDFDGDGRADAGLIRLEPGATTPTALYVAISTGKAFAPVGAPRLALPDDLSAARFATGDFTGDGRADLAMLVPVNATTELRVAGSSPARTLAAPRLWTVDGLPTATLSFVVADIDRTGRDDIVVALPSGTGFRLMVNRATGTAFVRAWFGPALPQPLPTRMSAADLNADGRVDILVYEDLGVDPNAVPLGTSVLRLYSTAGSFTLSPWTSDAGLVFSSFAAY